LEKLGFKGAVRVWMLVAERLLENLRADQMANAMMVRFYQSNEHRVHWHQLRLTKVTGLFQV